MERVVQRGEIYRHFKGNLYQIVSMAINSETKEPYVVYQALYGDMQIWVRPYASFISEVDRHKYPQATQKYRFEAVSTLAGGITSVMPWAADRQEAVQEPVTQEEPIIAHTETEAEVDKRLLAFLDTDTYKEKLDYLSFIKNSIDDRLINDIAVAMDIMIEEGPVDKRYSSLVSCLQTMAKYECGRLR